MKTIDLKAVRIDLRDDGILHIHIKAFAELKMAEAQEALKAMRLIGDGQKYPVLIDAGEFAHIDPDVRVFSASEEGNIYTIADAIAYHSLAQKMLANFYVVHNKPVVPTKTFAENDQAIAWLKTFLKVKV
jgi:hypothetical protein